jgi:hypothetical protein
MRRVTYFAALAALAISCDALAVGSLADVSIIDRDTGEVLPVHYYHGEYWVAGRPGARYAIEVRNCAEGRLLAVTSVDGVNVLSGNTAGWNQTGYVFDAGEDYRISGWRKSHTEVADFTFTDLPNSYAARTGRPANVGVIGLAVFRELTPPPAPVPKVGGPTAGKPAPLPADSLTRSNSMSARASSAGAAFAEAPVAAPKLGTGHGEREYSYVVDTAFRRAQSEPNEVIRIRYDSLDNLVAMGIVMAPAPTTPVPNPFPRSSERQFVPDPPG